MGILEIPQVIKAPTMQPINEPAAATSPPCQRKIDEISRRRYPIDRKLAISLTLERTVIESTLKIPKPARRITSETVMAAERRRVRKRWRVDASRSCQLSASCSNKA